MVFDVLFYDEYYDIPLRGLLQTDSSTMAFDACILDDEPAEIADRRGVYSRIRAFACDDALIQLFQESDAIFRKWRAAFDNGDVDTSTHPLYVDARFQELSIRKDEFFSRLGPPIIEANGLMRVESGRFVFEPCGLGR
jgi:hypothetical protein